MDNLILKKIEPATDICLQDTGNISVVNTSDLGKD